MLTQSELREEHERQFDGRPQRIQRLREELREHCGVEVPRSLPAVPEWYDKHKSVITKALADAADGSGGES